MNIVNVGEVFINLDKVLYIEPSVRSNRGSLLYVAFEGDVSTDVPGEFAPVIRAAIAANQDTEQQELDDLMGILMKGPQNENEH